MESVHNLLYTGAGRLMMKGLRKTACRTWIWLNTP